VSTAGKRKKVEEGKGKRGKDKRAKGKRQKGKSIRGGDRTPDLERVKLTS
jgi:hypothetical protein